MAQSSQSVKLNKPCSAFLLLVQNNGSLPKKIRGRLHYFDLRVDLDGTLAECLGEVDDMNAGCLPRANSDVLALRELCN